MGGQDPIGNEVIPNDNKYLFLRCYKGWQAKKLPAPYNTATLKQPTNQTGYIQFISPSSKQKRVFIVIRDNFITNKSLGQPSNFTLSMKSH